MCPRRWSLPAAGSVFPRSLLPALTLLPMLLLWAEPQRMCPMSHGEWSRVGKGKVAGRCPQDRMGCDAGLAVPVPRIPVGLGCLWGRCDPDGPLTEVAGWGCGRPLLLWELLPLSTAPSAAPARSPCARPPSFPHLPCQSSRQDPNICTRSESYSCHEGMQRGWKHLGGGWSESTEPGK